MHLRRAVPDSAQTTGAVTSSHVDSGAVAYYDCQGDIAAQPLELPGLWDNHLHLTQRRHRLIGPREVGSDQQSFANLCFDKNQKACT